MVPERRNSTVPVFVASARTVSGKDGPLVPAHSAGNPIAAEALRQLSRIHYDLDNDEARRRTRIGHVVFAGLMQQP